MNIRHGARAELPHEHPNHLTALRFGECQKFQNSTLLGSMSAEQRVSSFLLNLSGRFDPRGNSPREFALRITRDDTGNPLGMKLETVSRARSRFHCNGIIAVSGKWVTRTDREALRGL